MRVGLTYIGVNVGKALRAHAARTEKAVRTVVPKVGRGMKAELQATTAAAGLGKLAKAWNFKVSDRGGFDIVAYVTVKGASATRALRAFSKGVTILPRQGKYLAVPLPAAGRGPRGARMTPELFTQRTGLELRLVKRPGRNALLVTAGRVDTRGRARRNERRTRDGGLTTRLAGLASVPVFVLIPRAYLAKRFNRKGIVAAWRRRLVTMLRDEMKRATQ